MTKKPIHSDGPIEALLGAAGADFRSEFETLKSDSAYGARRDAAIGQALAAFSCEQEGQSVSRSAKGSLRERIAELFSARPAWSLPAMSGAAFVCTVLFAVTLTGREASISPNVPMRMTEQRELPREVVSSEAASVVDQSGIDQSGIDQSGIDQSGIDQSGIDQPEFESSVIPDSAEGNEASLLSSVGPVIEAVGAEGAEVEEVVGTSTPVDVFAYPDPPVSLDLTDVELAYEDGFDVQGLEGVGTISDEDLFLMEDYSDEAPIA